MTTITLSSDQQIALDMAVAKIRAREQCVTIGGYAGTGKTTITGQIVRILRAEFPRIAFCCFTGKAYKVLESKLLKFEALTEGDYCGTIHGLVYNAHRRRIKREEDGVLIEENKYEFSGKDSNGSYDLIVVDEASMVNEIIYNKLLEFNVPILAIGDHGQLPPIKGSFNLMANPQIRLTRIHRQAENDPIIRMSIHARDDGRIPFGDHGNGSSICLKTDDESFVDKTVNPLEWAIIAGTNRKRVERNKWARWKLGMKGSVPEVGDRVVCLQNVHAANVFNGMTGTVSSVFRSEFLAEKYQNSHFITLGVRMDADIDYFSNQVFRYQFYKEKPLRETVVDPPLAREVDPDDFGHLWDFGYCLTAHKSQGSEWDNVVVYEENSMRKLMERTMGDDGWRRWLYTAVTRSKKQLIIIGE